MVTVLEPRLARDPAPESSDRSFGLVMAGACAVIGLLPLLHSKAPHWWLFGVAVALIAVAFIRPYTLHPINRAWLAIGRLLHRIMSPLVMGAVFFVCVTPIAWVMRLQGKDLLSLSRRPDLSSYWIPRDPSPPASESMRQQF